MRKSPPRPGPSPRRGGFTVIEMLVVAGVVTLLLALIFPAVQMSREAARRTTCQSNLRQVMLATTNYAATHRVFPAGSALGWSIHATLLPYLDEGNRAEALPTDHSVFEFMRPGADPPFPENPPAVYRCPSDGGNDGSAANVASGAGTGRKSTAQNGLFRAVGEGNAGGQKRLSPGRVRDGLTQTVAFSEMRAYTRDRGNGIRSAPRDDTDPPTRLLTDCERLAAAGGLDAGFGGGRPWEGFGQYLGVVAFNHHAPPNASPCTNDGDIYAGTYPVSADHRGGVNAATADGGVRFVIETVDLALWRAAGTPAGGEALSFPD